NLEGSHGLVGRRGEGFAGAQTEPRAVPRTDDLTVFHFSSPESLAVVCAPIFNGVELIPTAYDDNGGIVDLHREGRAVSERLGAADVDPFRVGVHSAVGRAW